MKNTEKKPTKRALQAEKTKKRILKVSSKLINQHGFENVSLTQICEEADCSIGTFYHYFSSKDEILMSAYRAADEKESQYLSEHPPIGNCIEKIIHIFELQSEIAVELGVAFMTELYRNQIVVENNYLFSTDRVMPNTLYEIICEGQTRGEITDEYPADFLVEELMKFARGLFYDWCAKRGAYDHTESMKKSMNLFLKGFCLK